MPYNKSDNMLAYKYLEQCHNVIADICAPLTNHLGITLFCYIKTYSDGRYFSLANDLSWRKFYFQNIHYEKLIWPESIILDSTSKTCAPKPVLWPEHPTCFVAEQIIKHNYWNGIDFISFTPEYSESWIFAGEKSNTNLKSLYINKSHLFYKFIAYFNDKAKHFLSPCKPPFAIHKDGIDYPIKWPDSSVGSEEIFLKEIGYLNKPINFSSTKNKVLTSQECVCLSLLVKGMTSKEIGKYLKISNRTVETHIQNIKNKTGHYLRSDLINFFQESYL